MANAVAEYFKQKSNLILTKEEVISWKSYLHYSKYKTLYKRCTRCNQIKHISEFYKNPLKKQGVFDYCKECAKRRKYELDRERKRNNQVNGLS